ncbi:MAG TPA: alpha/beta hydrolase [Candidatus Binataceae bacterium]|nr:alpha/beta hydrolase [Candidatus Binataceae bacterium]
MYDDATAATATAEPINRFIEINGLKLHCLDWGGNPERHTILLVHGGSAHAHWWDYVAPRLTAHGRALALDFRGHGRSQWANPPLYGLEVYLQELIGFISQYIQTRVILVGHSMGGHVAQLLAQDRPDLLEALIAIDSPPNGPPLTTRLKWRWKRRKQGGPRPEFGTAHDLVRRFRLSPPGHALTPSKLEDLALKGSEQLPNGNWAFRFDPETRVPRTTMRSMRRPRLRRIELPVLVLRGANSALMSRSSALKMHRQLPRAILKEIDGAYHHVPLDQPDATVSAIAEFIQTL